MLRRFARLPAPHILAVSALIGLTATGLTGCTDRPDLSGRVPPVDRSLPWPSLAGLSTLFPDATETEADAALAEDRRDPAEMLAARARALQWRGRTLSTRPVLSPAERQYLMAAIARHPATD